MTAADEAKLDRLTKEVIAVSREARELAARVDRLTLARQDPCAGRPALTVIEGGCPERPLATEDDPQ